MSRLTGRAHVHSRRVALTALAFAACGSVGGRDDTGLSGGGTDNATSGDDGAPSSSTTGATSAGDEGDGPRLDVGYETEGAQDSGGAPTCEVSDDGDAPPPCEDEAPPNSFEPDVQWSFMGRDGEVQSVVSPVVTNLTDDNGDGAIDLCDTPDVIVTLYAATDPDGWSPWQGSLGHVYVLDGETGALHTLKRRAEVGLGLGLPGPFAVSRRAPVAVTGG